MIRSFKLVIRDSTDTGKKRQKTTPSPQIIEKNIDNFLRQRGHIQTNVTQVLPELSRKAIEKSLRTCAWDVNHSYQYPVELVDMNASTKF